MENVYEWCQKSNNGHFVLTKLLTKFTVKSVPFYKFEQPMGRCCAPTEFFCSAPCQQYDELTNFKCIFSNITPTMIALV